MTSYNYPDSASYAFPVINAGGGSSVFVPVGKLIYPINTLAANSGVGSVTLSNGKIGYVVQAPISGDIERFAFQMATVTTGAIMDCRIETVNSVGQPTGTLWGTDTNNAAFTINNTDDDLMLEVTLTSPATVVKGDLIALVVSNPAASFGNMQFRTMIQPFSPTIPYGGTNNGSAWSKSQFNPPIALYYAGGTRVAPAGCIPARNFTTQTVNSGTTPDEVGNKITLPFSCKVSGIVGVFSGPATATVNVKIYSAADALLVDKPMTNQQSATTGVAMKYWYFDDVITLDKDTVYRVAIQGTNATNWLMGYIDSDSTTWVDTWDLGQNCVWTERTDLGAWTETNTKRAMLSLLIDEIPDDA